MTTILLVLLLNGPASQIPSDLSGRWVREAPSRAGAG